MLSFLSNYSSWGVWFLQFAIGLIFVVHGWPKMKNTKNFFGIGGTVHGLIEVVCSVLMWFSWYVRVAAAIFSIIMLGAIYFKKFKWHTPFTSHTINGWEFDFILLAANIFLMVR